MTGAFCSDAEHWRHSTKLLAIHVQNKAPQQAIFVSLDDLNATTRAMQADLSSLQAACLSASLPEPVGNPVALQRLETFEV